MNNLKPIPWYEWLYGITIDWKVWSYPKWTYKEGRWLSPHNRKWWYLKVSLYKNKKMYSPEIQRLVALTHIPNPENKPQVNHIDWNTANNHISNLEWCTNRENAIHAQYTLKTRSTPEQIDKIRKICSKPVMQMTREWILCKIYPSAIEAARQNKMHQGSISSCARWNTEYAYWYRWKYVTA